MYCLFTSSKRLIMKPNYSFGIFYTNHLGEPAGFKSSQRLSIDEAWEKWHQLFQKGWTEVSHEYG